jgi:hypothetical protein
MQSTLLNGILSSPKQISAGVIQGSVLGPTLFNINSTTLSPLYPTNYYFKYADDGYLIVPASNTFTLQLEIDHQSKWASSCNLKLNATKTSEIIFTRKKASPPPPHSWHPTNHNYENLRSTCRQQTLLLRSYRSNHHHLLTILLCS